MIRGTIFVRFTSCLLHSRVHGMTTVTGVDKSLLSKLRKRTGISFINCKKALEQFDNDIQKAEKWLKEQSQKEGWAKASKLQSRSMANGLIAVISDQDSATMIEVNCETDFVARNQKFIHLTTALARECHKAFLQRTEPVVLLDKAVCSIAASDGKTLADRVALEVGNIGENMMLRRAVHLKGANSMLSSYVHASGPEISSEDDCRLGKYGVLLSVSQKEPPTLDPVSALDIDELSRLVGQHIVGMNPKSVGQAEEEVAADGEAKAGEGMSEDGKGKEKPEEERLLYQEFLLDPGMTVGKLLRNNSVQVNTFYRFECGEQLPGDNNEQ